MIGPDSDWSVASFSERLVSVLNSALRLGLGFEERPQFLIRSRSYPPACPAFNSFFYAPQNTPAFVHALALVRIELLLDGWLAFDRHTLRVCRELFITVFADCQHWDIGDSLYDSKIALRH
jgi:hypothetical protein